MGAKNKTCVTKTLFTNFTRRNNYCLLQVWKNLFIVLKIRSHAKLTCIFVLRVVSLSASSLVVYCLQCNLNVLYLHDSTQCYEQRTTHVQPQFVVRSLRILIKTSVKNGLRILSFFYANIPRGSVTKKKGLGITFNSIESFSISKEDCRENKKINIWCKTL